MKQFLCILLTLCLLFTVVACNETTDPAETSASGSESTSATIEPESSEPESSEPESSEPESSEPESSEPESSEPESSEPEGSQPITTPDEIIDTRNIYENEDFYFYYPLGYVKADGSVTALVSEDTTSNITVTYTAKTDSLHTLTAETFYEMMQPTYEMSNLTMENVRVDHSEISPNVPVTLCTFESVVTSEPTDTTIYQAQIYVTIGARTYIITVTAVTEYSASELTELVLDSLTLKEPAGSSIPSDSVDPTITAPDGYQIFQNAPLVFAYPEEWVETAGATTVLSNASGTGNNITVSVSELPPSTPESVFFEQLLDSIIQYYESIGAEVVSSDTTEKTNANGIELTQLSLSLALNDVPITQTVYGFAEDGILYVITLSEGVEDLALRETVFNTINIIE